MGEGEGGGDSCNFFTASGGMGGFEKYYIDHLSRLIG